MNWLCVYIFCRWSGPSIIDPVMNIYLSASSGEPHAEKHVAFCRWADQAVSPSHSVAAARVVSYSHLHTAELGLKGKSCKKTKKKHAWINSEKRTTALRRGALSQHQLHLNTRGSAAGNHQNTLFTCSAAMLPSPRDVGRFMGAGRGWILLAA